MKKLTFSKAVFPNMATGLNVFSGFLSVVYASQNDFRMAAIFIFIAAFFDLLDGIIARILKTSSRLGVELDSLADVVSFGMAPSFLLYKSFFISQGWPGLIISSLLLLFGAFRLARFNVQLEDISTKLDFKGLPIPTPAVAIASIILFYHNGVSLIHPFSDLMIPIVLLFSFLMVSTIKYNSLPKVKYLKLGGKIILFGTAFIALFLVVITNGVAFFYLVSAHILFGILRAIYNFIFKNSDDTNIKLRQKPSESMN